jgi:quercetin dioxygenase-like cupin family protein
MSFDREQFQRATILTPGQGQSVWAFGGDRCTIKAGVGTTGRGLGLVEADVPPGNGPPMHTHQYEDEGFYILSGQLEVAAGNEVVAAPAGTFIWLPQGVPHRFRNLTDDVSRMLLLFSPAGFERLFLEVGQPVTGDSPPPPPDEVTLAADMARSRQIAEGTYGITPV